MVLQSQSACASKRIVSRAARCGRENGEVELRCDYSPELFAVRADLLCYERTLCLKVANLCGFFSLGPFGRVGRAPPKGWPTSLHSNRLVSNFINGEMEGPPCLFVA